MKALVVADAHHQAAAHAQERGDQPVPIAFAHEHESYLHERRTVGRVDHRREVDAFLQPIGEGV